MRSTVEFHPSVQGWFEASFAAPTPVQSASWPVIAAGQHALITAPTGSGKTLTAFLWSLSQFASGQFAPGQTRVLYISPLKALNNDIQRNLMAPLAALERDYQCPAIRVGLRSGDTPANDRQRLLRQPPDILITTPESLGLMLTTAKGRLALSHVDTLILDEVHSIVDNRRGVALMTHIERLADLAGEFQRIALSATVQPLATVAQFIAGRDAQGQPRHVEIVDAPQSKQIDFRVRFPEAAKQAAQNGKKIWEPLSDDFRDLIKTNHSTLFFTNSRRLAEKITLKINQEQPAPIAYAHHGSLSRDVRSEVESRLKAGELQAIVATNSLEMGIDIGHLDEVVMVQSPPSVAATIQRIGRAGHQVGEVSRGTLYPTHAWDFLEAAVLAETIARRDIEPLRPMQGALDVLAQVIISICATDAWRTDDVYQLVTRATPYANLARQQFDLVVDMLSGRYSGSRIRELKARVTHDRINHTIAATRGAVLSLYNSGGTIPDRGYFKMRHADSGGILGELDEEFVWEATIGDTFTLGTQHWQIQRITHNDVIVRNAPAGSQAPPFWRSEFFNRSYHFSSRIGQYLEMQETALAGGRQAESVEDLQSRHGFADTAATELMDFLADQRSHTHSPLPHRHHILLELVRTGPAGYHGPDNPQQLILHTGWGGQLNQPYALALRAAWQSSHGVKLDVHADNNAIVVQCKGEVDPHQIMSLVSADNLLPLLRRSLEGSGFFGARFRECAGRSLLLTKQRFNQRLPLWMSRMQAKKLLAQVKQLADFPVVLETWRTCLDDEFDLPNLLAVLAELQAGTTRWTFTTTTSPSPFARNLTFDQVSRYMYADDTPENDELSVLGDDLIAQAVHNQALRPTVSDAIVQAYVAKRQRRHPGYEPDGDDDWAEWLKERVLIPANEIAELQDHPFVHKLRLDGRVWYTHLELVAGLHDCGLFPQPPPAGIPQVPEQRTAGQICREILSFYGPMTADQIEQLLPSLPDDVLVVDDTFICGQLTDEADQPQWCDADNFEILLRMQRAQRRQALAIQPATQLPEFWASLHRLSQPANEINLLFALESLRGYPVQAKTWLTDLLHARLQGVRLTDVDELLQHSDIGWQGTGKQSITLGYPEDLVLTCAHPGTSELAQWFSDPAASYSFAHIAERAGLAADQLNPAWWQAVWRGQLHSDSLTSLQQAAARDFEVTSLSQQHTSRRRLRRPSRSWSGNWRLLPQPEPADPLTALEEDKERVRLLLDRYGFVCRDLINREALLGGGWRWRHGFRALRIMELSGEVIAGQFFAGLSTPQFISAAAISQLQTYAATPRSYWVAAQDPASPCGLGLDWPALPARRAGNYLSFHAGKLALVINAWGKSLQYFVDWDDADIDQVNAPLHYLVDQQRLRPQIQTINGDSARASAYLQPLQRLFRVVADHKHVSLESRHP